MASKKNQFGLDIYDYFVLVVSFMGILVLSYVLWDETLINKYLQTNSSKQLVIGRVTEINNDVRRRMQRSLTWYSLNDSESVYEGDSLFTGNMSTTEVVLSDGVNININENSLVYLSSLNNELVLNLESGQILANINAKQKINLVQNGKVAMLDASNSGKIQIQRSKDGKIKLSSQNVKLNINSGGEQKTINNKNEEVQIDLDLKLEKTIYEIELTKPSTGDIFMTNKDFKLKWNLEKKNFEAYRVLISEKPDFAQSIQIDSRNKELLWSLPKKDQKYYWKVEAKSVSAEAKSSLSWFYIVNPKKVQLQQPVNNLSLELDHSDQKKEILFAWIEKYKAESYQFQLSQAYDFEKNLLDINTNQAHFGPEDLSTGEYFWRVRAQYSNKIFSAWSEPYSLKLTHEATLPDTAFIEPVVDPAVETAVPVKVQPEVNFKNMSMEKPVGQSKSSHTINFKSGAKGRSPQSLKKYIKNPPELSWIKVKGAQEYQLEISKDKIFDSLVVSPKVNNLKFVWTTARPGEYFWRVKALGEMGQIGPWSDVERLSVKVQKPRIKGQVKTEKVKSIEDLNRPEKITVSWSKVPYASSYSLELSEVKSGKKKSIKNKSNSFNLNMKTGQSYKVKVLAVDSAGRSISSLSNAAEMRVEKSLEVNTPKPLLPQDGVTMVSFDDSVQPVLFKWSKIKNAETYIFEISDSTDFKKLIVKKTLKKNDYLQAEALPKSKMYWRVKAVYQNYSSEFSEPRAFGY